MVSFYDPRVKELGILTSSRGHSDVARARHRAAHAAAQRDGCDVLSVARRRVPCRLVAIRDRRVRANTARVCETPGQPLGYQV